MYNGVGMDVQIPAFAGMTGVFAGMTECPREREGRCVYNGVRMTACQDASQTVFSKYLN